MADDAGRDMDGDEDGESAAPVKGKKLLLLIVLAVLLLGGVGAGLYFSGLLGGSGKEAEEKPAAEAPKEGDAAKAAPQYDENGNLIGGPVYYEMPEFLVNLSTTGKKASFLKMKVTLELSGAEMVPIIDANKPRLQDVFNTYLRELRASDLSGSAGIYRLREELLMRVNTALQPNKVNDILFSEIIVQ